MGQFVFIVWTRFTSLNLQTLHELVCSPCARKRQKETTITLWHWRKHSSKSNAAPVYVLRHGWPNLLQCKFKCGKAEIVWSHCFRNSFSLTQGLWDIPIIQCLRIRAKSHFREGIKLDFSSPPTSVHWEIDWLVQTQQCSFPVNISYLDQFTLGSFAFRQQEVTACHTSLN